MALLRRWLANLLLSVLALVFSLLAGEWMSRLLLEPINYLNPTLVPDAYLGHRIENGTGGHDEWGFRNFSIPESAEIVAVGDSMTYGVAALADQSYPLVLGRDRGVTVYNMGLGGYGPLQYLHLVRTRVPPLEPQTVIVGFYFGNDLMDAYNLAESHAAWREYAGVVIPEPQEGRVLARVEKSTKAFGGIRDWFSRNSVLYRVVTSSAIFDRFREREFKALDTGTLEARLGGRRMLFAWQDPAVYLDLSDARGVAGLDITKLAFREMALETRRRGMRLIVAMFPLKESVYEDYLRASADIKGIEKLLSMVENERKVKAVLQAYFESEGISYIDLLPALVAANVEQDTYPLTDAHPNARGYAAIAAVIDAELSRRASGSN
jgi:hypothetical protein